MHHLLYSFQLFHFFCCISKTALKPSLSLSDFYIFIHSHKTSPNVAVAPVKTLTIPAFFPTGSIIIQSCLSRPYNDWLSSNKVSNKVCRAQLSHCFISLNLPVLHGSCLLPSDWCVGVSLEELSERELQISGFTEGYGGKLGCHRVAVTFADEQ